MKENVREPLDPAREDSQVRMALYIIMQIMRTQRYRQDTNDTLGDGPGDLPYTPLPTCDTVYNQHSKT